MLSGTEELGGHPVRLEEPILYFIQEVQIKQKFIGPDIQTVLVFAQPWKIEIYSYVTNQINPRSILLSSLCSVWLPC